MQVESPDPNALRASDLEREQVVDRLRRETTVGRLTLEEFSDRLEEVYRCKTRGELQLALRELPQERLPSEEDEPVLEEKVRARYRRRLRNEIATFATSNFVCTSIWLMGDHGYFWPGWVLMGTTAGLIGTALKGRDEERDKLEKAAKAKERRSAVAVVERRHRG